MRIRIKGADYAPEELEEQVPFEADLIRQIAGPDRPDYWLATLTGPIRWVRDGDVTAVTHLVLAARWQGTTIGPGMHNLPVGIAYVVDPTVMEDKELDLAKCAYVAIGVADEVGSV